MPGTRVELAEIALPEFGLPREEPTIPAATYEARIASARQRAYGAGYDVLMVYADREHFANLAYLTGFDPRFEEALLILTQDQTPTLLVGNEDMAYTAISPIDLRPVLFQTFSLLSQPRSSSAPLTTILLQLMRAYVRICGVYILQCFLASMTLKSSPSDWSEKTTRNGETIQSTDACLRPSTRCATVLGQQ